MGIIKFVAFLAIGIVIGQVAKTSVLNENVKDHRYYLEQQCVRDGKATVLLKGKTLGMFPPPTMDCARVIESLHAPSRG
jgi:hypothetical protein